MSKKLHIEIFGRQYTLRGQSNQGYADQLATYVDENIREISKHSLGSPFSNLAVLSAINIAHELFQLKDRQKKLDLAQKKLNTAINGKARTLIENIEEVL